MSTKGEKYGYRCNEESSEVITDIAHEHADPTAVQDGYDKYTASMEIGGQTYSDTDVVNVLEKLFNSGLRAIQMISNS